MNCTSKSTFDMIGQTQNRKLTETEREELVLVEVDSCLEFVCALKSFWYDCSTLFNASIAFQFLDLKA